MLKVALPKFVVAAIREQYNTRLSIDADALVFCNRSGGPLPKNNVHRRLRDVVDKTGLKGATRHSFRRTGATAINEAGSIDLAAELFVHTDPRITARYYIVRNDLMSSATVTVH